MYIWFERIPSLLWVAARKQRKNLHYSSKRLRVIVEASKSTESWPSLPNPHSHHLLPSFRNS